MYLTYRLRGLGLPEMPISGTSTPLWEYITTAMRQPYIRQKGASFLFILAFLMFVSVQVTRRKNKAKLLSQIFNVKRHSRPMTLQR